MKLGTTPDNVTVACIHNDSWAFACTIVEEHWKKMKMEEEKSKFILPLSILVLCGFVGTEWSAGSLMLKLSSQVGLGCTLARHAQMAREAWRS